MPTEPTATAQSHLLPVTRIVRETHDSVSVHFRPTPVQLPALGYTPGQFLTLRLPTADGGWVSRCYSLASTPDLDDDLVVTVKRVTGGPGSNHLCDLVGATSPVTVEALPPTGVFTPKDWDADLLLVAGGSGVTPIMSILRAALARGGGRLTVLYANRDDRSVIFAGRLAQLAAEHPDRLVVHHWIETVQGLPSVATVKALTDRMTFDEAFVCGPTPFMHCVRDALKESGHSRATVHLEKFTSLSGDPFEGVELADPTVTSESAPEIVDAQGYVAAPAGEGAPASEPATAPEAAPATTPDREQADTSDPEGAGAVDSTVHVEIDGEEHTFPWPAGQLLLDVLKNNGVKAPSSCAEGVCAACECQKTDGEVTMLRNEVLDEDDLEEGYILACQSVALTPVVKITYG